MCVSVIKLDHKRKSQDKEKEVLQKEKNITEYMTLKQKGNAGDERVQRWEGCCKEKEGGTIKRESCMKTSE